MTEFFFYVFASVIAASAFMVIAARNPVHSVLFLILAFFNAAGIFLLAGAEFLAMTLVIVYVGAVAVLFLFAVMMLDVNLTELKEGILQYLPIGGTIGIILFVEIVLVAVTWLQSSEPLTFTGLPSDSTASTNTHALGEVLYTDYILAFQGSGLILLVAMIGAIVLTLREREGVKKQNISTQIARQKAQTIELKKAPSRQGITS
jgi:NADH-quinone oxidoreductase subunit J